MEEKVRKILDEVKQTIKDRVRSHNITKSEASLEELERLRSDMLELFKDVPKPTPEDVRPFRLEVSLPRSLNQKVELMKREIWETKGRRISKSSLVVEILEEFFSHS